MSCELATTGSTSVGVAHRTPTVAPANLNGPITTGQLIVPLSPHPMDLAAHGYVEEEFFAGGIASSYAASGTLGSDGRWSVDSGSSAEYQTRLVVRRPSDPKKFNGIVAVEWYNVSGGLEAAPDWTYLGDELVREGYAYVGVSVQSLGINGGHGVVQRGGDTNGGLQSADAARYGTLSHPGDAYALDIFSQVGAALRSPGEVPVLGPLTARRILAVGESQSAYFLTTYVNAVQPLADVYDGFFLHSRGGTAPPLDGQIASGGVPGTHIRTDLDVPIFMFETESDLGNVIDFGPARQADTNRIRTWEVAGTAHADSFLVGEFAGALGCAGRINEGPQRFVARAALHALYEWIEQGVEPPTAKRLEIDGNPPAATRDQHGIARGGVRTPSVDVPVSTLSGEAPPGASLVCSLFGSTTPFSADVLAALYSDGSVYLETFESSLDAAIVAGFVRPADREEYLAEARTQAP